MLNQEANDLPKNLDINSDFKLALDLMENTNLSVFITGNAGTGKTTLQKLFRSTTKKKIVTLAPTGIGALNSGGQTIHSFFRFPPKLLQKEDVKMLYHDALIKSLDAIIIDEVSMVRADLMDAVDYALRINRERMDLPFGGVQVLLFGDLLQLPPVTEKEAIKVLEKKYATPYFFSAKVFDECGIEYVELSKIYRQMDTQFVDILNKIRNKQHTEKDLELLNARVRRNAIRSVLDKTIILTPTNSLANAINRDRLSSLPAKEYKYDADIRGRFDEHSYPTNSSLRLKEGARVILLKNDIAGQWVNGTLAKIAQLSDSEIRVDIDGYICRVPVASWKKIEYYYNERKGRIEENVVGEFIQYPLKLAWSITIHKSQGYTLDRLVLDLGHGAFAHGQTYVALSRCVSLDGITLRRPIIYSDIIFDERIYGFRERFNVPKKK